MKRLLVFTLLLGFLSACEDDPEKSVNPVIVPTAANFYLTEVEISEETEVYEIAILLSANAEADGMLEVAIGNAGEYGIYFTTEPAVFDGKISLAVSKGDSEVSFTVKLVNNTKLNGNRAITFSMVMATGSVKLGENINHKLTLVDDELRNKLYSYEMKGIAQSKNIYEYNVDGLVAKVSWESKNPFETRQGTDTYFYEDEKITHVERSTSQVKYTWEDERIKKMEILVNNVVLQYAEYSYDEAGILIRKDNFNQQPSGAYELISFVEYTYHGDGNVHEMKSYYPANGEFTLHSTLTYEGYIEGYNPFAMVSLLPDQNIQPKLHTYYSLRTQTAFLEYTISYELNEQGYPTKRTISGPPAGAGEATFLYY